jgi:DNA primase
MSVIDEVKQRTDIIGVAGRYTTLAKAGRNLKGLCPFHSEKHASFFIYPEQQTWHCFGACGTGGDVFSLVMKKEAIGFGDALRLLAEEAGVTIPSGIQASDKGKNDRLFAANEAASQYFHHLLLNSAQGKKAGDYVARRGLSAKAITDFQLGFSPNSRGALKKYLAERGYAEDELITAGLLIDTEGSPDRFRNRLMFPIRDARGRSTGFGARALDSSQPKYTNSPQTPVFDKSGMLYGLDAASEAIRHQERAVIVEGYTDVITAHQNEFTNVVASMGTAITEKQINAIKKLTRNIVLALDADTAGGAAALRAVSYENALGAEVMVALLPQGEDPDNVIRQSPQTWQRLVDAAVPVMDYTFTRAVSELDLGTARGKSAAVDKLLPIISEIKDVVRQSHYLQKLSLLVNTSQHKLEMVMEKNKSSAGGRFVRAREPAISSNHRRTITASPREEYCLALLLQHPELKAISEELLPQYFENSENREILDALRQAEDTAAIKDKLDNTIWDYFDHLMGRNILQDQIEDKLSSCILRLREEYLRGLEEKRGAILASEAAAKGSDAELAKLKEQGIEVSIELREVAIQKSRQARRQRRDG